MPILASPATPYLLASLACALLAAIGLTLLSQGRLIAAGMRLMASPTELRGRYLIGNLAGVPSATILLLGVLAGNPQGSLRLLLLAGAGAVYLYLAWVLPRRPLVAQQREADRLRRLTPGFIAFVRVALDSFEAPTAIMRRYLARPVPSWALMQGLVQEALRVGLDQRLRPFAALSAVARQRACRELIDVTDALAQAEREGGNIRSVLEAQQATLELVLQSEFKRMLRRRTLYLLLMVAVSLVVGILLNLLFTMTAGGGVLRSLGG